MKFTASLIIFLYSVHAWGDNSPCADLSHISQLGAGEVHVTQPACDKWLRQGYFQGQPYGDVQEIMFSPVFMETKVDDQFERFASNQRWFWASSRQDILIHEYTIDSFDKSSKVSTFSSGSESFAIDGDKIKLSGQKMVRTTSADGMVSVTIKPVTSSYERIKKFSKDNL